MTFADLGDILFSTPAMAAVFSGEARVRQMLAFEAALARAEARAGVIPIEAAEAIGAACRLESVDVEVIFRETGVTGTPVIPLVRMLASRVEGEARRHVHWGATSQDAIDTGLVLQVREGLDLLETGLLAVGEACAVLAERYRATPMAGRTVMQQALPITFGLKAARWLALVMRLVGRLEDLRARALVVQLGGAAGTLASLGAAGPEVTAYLAEELGLAEPEMPWHAERDRVAEVAATLGIVAGGMAKIAGDVLLLGQTEVGEVSEGAAPGTGKGGSSAMPHKRNPVDATVAAAAARLALGEVPVVLAAMAQEHERAAGGWQAEWAAIPNLFRYTGCAVERVGSAVAGLEVRPEQMRANLEQTGGLLMAEALSLALAPHLGRQAAFGLVQAACERAVASGRDLRSAIGEEERVQTTLGPEELDALLEPGSYLGSTDTYIQRALEGFRALADGTRRVQ